MSPLSPQAGSGLEPQANGETPHVAVIVRPGKCLCQGWVCQLVWLLPGSRCWHCGVQGASPVVPWFTWGLWGQTHSLLTWGLVP